MRAAGRGARGWIGVALLAAACGGGADAGGTGRGGDGRSRLTVAVSADAGPLNPYLGAPDALLNLVYDKLFEPSPLVPAPVPSLAERADQIDPVTWVVTLRDGITWHDGRPFTAEDVQFTYEYYRDGPPTRHAHHVSMVPRIDRIEAIGPLQVRFVCGYPCSALARVTFADLPILPAHVWRNVPAPRQYTDLPIGTGPYVAADYRPERYYRFTANPRYFRGAPAVDELVMPIVPDLSATFIALRTGEIDAASRQVPPELVAEFAAVEALKVVRTSNFTIVELRPNYARPPFDRRDFRRAISLAVDRQALADTVLFARGRPGDRGSPHPDSPWTDPGLRTPLDREQAAALLDGLGYVDRDGDGVREGPDGSPLSFTVSVASGSPAWVRLAELLVPQFRRVGIGLRVQTLEAGVFNEQILAQRFDFYLNESGSHAIADPDQFTLSLQTGYLTRGTSVPPELRQAVEDWKQARTSEDRLQAGYRLQRRLLDEYVAIALVYPQAFWAFRPAAYDRWLDAPGFGIVHKWSFLPAGADPPGVRPPEPVRP